MAMKIGRNDIEVKNRSRNEQVDKRHTLDLIQKIRG
jgi:hypothetical protein